MTRHPNAGLCRPVSAPAGRTHVRSSGHQLTQRHGVAAQLLHLLQASTRCRPARQRRWRRQTAGRSCFRAARTWTCIVCWVSLRVRRSSTLVRFNTFKRIHTHLQSLLPVDRSPTGSQVPQLWYVHLHVATEDVHSLSREYVYQEHMRHAIACRGTHGEPRSLQAITSMEVRIAPHPCHSCSFGHALCCCHVAVDPVAALRQPCHAHQPMLHHILQLSAQPPCLTQTASCISAIPANVLMDPKTQKSSQTC